MSCMRSARLAVPGGTPIHARGGDWLAPSQLNSLGMAPPSANDGLVTVNCAAGAVVDSAGAADEVVVDESPRELLPPFEPHAAAVTRRTTASLRSTGSF